MRVLHPEFFKNCKVISIKISGNNLTLILKNTNNLWLAESYLIIETTIQRIFRYLHQTQNVFAANKRYWNT
jgi:hypothetical protein